MVEFKCLDDFEYFHAGAKELEQRIEKTRVFFTFFLDVLRKFRFILTSAVPGKNRLGQKGLD